MIGLDGRVTNIEVKTVCDNRMPGFVKGCSASFHVHFLFSEKPLANVFHDGQQEAVGEVKSHTAGQPFPLPFMP